MPPALSKVLNSAESKAFLSKARLENTKVLIIIEKGGKCTIGGDMSVESAQAHLAAHTPHREVQQPLTLPPLPRPMDSLCLAKYQDERRAYVRLLKAVFLPERTGSLGREIIFVEIINPYLSLIGTGHFPVWDARVPIAKFGPTARVGHKIDLKYFML